jgi:lysophospholipase L1-like esterase
MWVLLQRPVTGIGVLLAQVLRAAHRNDIPSLQDQDPSGLFGDPALPHVRIVVLGDSTVTAPGVIPLSAAWPQRVGQHLSDRFHVELHSVAVGGSKARDVLLNQLRPALGLQPDLAMISVGANDALRGTSIVRFEAEYTLILDRLQETIPLVIAGGVGDLGTVFRLPTLARAIGRVRGRAINNAIHRVAYGRTGVVKTQTWGGHWKGFEDEPDRYFGADQFHASAAGHGLFGAAACPAADHILSLPQAAYLTASSGNLGSGT